MKKYINIILPTFLQLVYSIVVSNVYVLTTWFFLGIEEGERTLISPETSKFICVLLTFFIPFAYNIKKIFSDNIEAKLKYKIALIANVLLCIFLLLQK